MCGKIESTSKRRAETVTGTDVRTKICGPEYTRRNVHTLYSGLDFVGDCSTSVFHKKNNSDPTRHEHSHVLSSKKKGCKKWFLELSYCTYVALILSRETTKPATL